VYRIGWFPGRVNWVSRRRETFRPFGCGGSDGAVRAESAGDLSLSGLRKLLVVNRDQKLAAWLRYRREGMSLPVFDSRWRTVLTPCPGSSQTILASLGRPKRHHPTFSPVFRPVARRSAPIAFYPNSDGRRRLAPPGLLSSWSIPLPTAHPAKFGSSHSPSPRPTSSLPAYSLIPLSMIPPPHRNRP
jgi:hypothetical protein